MTWESMKSGSIKWPRTWRGWRNLVLLTLRRCPRCKQRLLRDFPQYDDGDTVYCLHCDGLILPRGLIRTLIWNAAAREGKD